MDNSDSIFLPVIMCAWKRIDRLELTLEMLEAQTDKKFFLCIWNNNFDSRNDIEKIINNKSYSFQINIHHSNTNIKGFGRFFYAKRLLDEDNYPFVAFIDDDINFESNLIDQFKKQKQKESVKSFWAFRLKSPGNHYWRRENILPDKKDAHYCGTGGMILDSSIFLNDTFMNEIPEKYKDIEDLWLSFFASFYLKWQLSKADFPIHLMPDDEHNLYQKIHKKKDEFTMKLNDKYHWPSDYNWTENLKGYFFKFREKYFMN